MLFNRKDQDSIRRYLDKIKKESDTIGASDEYILLIASYVVIKGDELGKKRARDIWTLVSDLPRRGERAGPALRVDLEDRTPVTAAASVNSELRRYLTVLRSRLDRVELPASWGQGDFSLSSVFTAPPIQMIRVFKSFDTVGAAPGKAASMTASGSASASRRRAAPP